MKNRGLDHKKSSTPLGYKIKNKFSNTSNTYTSPEGLMTSLDFGKTINEFQNH